MPPFPRSTYRPDQPTPGNEETPLWDEGALAQRLTPREQLFVREYGVDLNATGAARRAHYRYPNGSAWRLMNKPHIRDAISAMLDERARRLGVQADEVLAEIALLAFASMADILEWGERAGPDGTMQRDVWLRGRDAAPEAVWRGVQEVRFAGGAIHVRMADKLTALNLLCKHLGLVGPMAGREGGSETAAETAASLAGDLAALSSEARDKIRAVLLEDHQRAATSKAVAVRDGEG